MVDDADIDLDQVRRALDERQNIVAVHYACQSFHEAKDQPPGIAAIALYDLSNNVVRAHSRSDAPEAVRAEAELHVLRAFYDDIGSQPDALVVHWNMDRPEFGFDALAKRFRYLTDGGESVPGRVPAPARRFDVDELIANQFGDGYAPHGKLESTAKLNGLDMRSFLGGKEEAELFKASDWATIARSTTSKAKIIGQLCRSLINGTLRTSFSVGMVQFGPSRLDAVSTVLQIGNRYILVRRSLGKHPHGRDPLVFENEWDDQYVIRALLALFFDDIRDEDPVPITAGSGSRIDFTLPDFSLAVELKRTRSGLEDKEIGVQLATDVQRYSSRADIAHLICLVFDFEGLIRNPRALEKDLSKSHSQPGLTVTVKIYDR